jgi:hypothetical protein
MRQFTVGYYMQDSQSKQFKTFETLAEARAFMQALNDDPRCESYGIERE